MAIHVLYVPLFALADNTGRGYIVACLKIADKCVRHQSPLTY